MTNVDEHTVQDFGQEWSTYDQSTLSVEELRMLFDEYFHIFPWDQLPPHAVGFDLGCGSGRWATQVASRVGTLHCIDASALAVEVARRNLARRDNCEFHVASVDAIPLDDESMDFGYSLGVLHHVPDTAAGITACVDKLKSGAPFLLYLYYAFDQRPVWFRAIWRTSDMLRQVISKLPYSLKRAVCSAIAAGIYLPLARGSLLLERAGVDVTNIPQSGYRRRSFYSMRTDALDRFGTRLEQRFTAPQIREMMERAGLERITFSDTHPFWTAVGYKRRKPTPRENGRNTGPTD